MCKIDKHWGAERVKYEVVGTGKSIVCILVSSKSHNPDNPNYWRWMWHVYVSDKKGDVEIGNFVDSNSAQHFAEGGAAALAECL